MTDSDLAIGAAGSTSWERCCLGLPSMIGALADNQIFIADALQTAGAAKMFVVDDEMTWLPALMAGFFNNQSEITKMIKCAANVTDGVGSNRVTSTLLNMRLQGQS